MGRITQEGKDWLREKISEYDLFPEDSDTLAITLTEFLTNY